MLKKIKRNLSLCLPVDVKNMIPHEETMRFVDSLVYLTDKGVHVSFKVPFNSPFIDEKGYIDELTFLEMTAQAMAVHAWFTDNTTSCKPLKGLLLGCKNLKINGYAEKGDVLIIKAFEQIALGNFSIIHGTVYKDDILLASGEIKIWKESK